jgi:hypothetical protein
MTEENKTEKIEKDEIIIGDINFLLKDGCTHVNSIKVSKSKLKELHDSMIDSLEKEDGIMSIKGSTENSNDLFLIPAKSIIAISFKFKKDG